MADCDNSDTTESLKTDPEADTTNVSENKEEEETAKVEPEKTKEKSIGKVEVRLQAAGDAPIMKQKNYNVRFFNALCL